MIVFPKLPKLRGKRAVYEVNGYVSATAPRYVGDDTHAGAKLHCRNASGDAVELAALNFVQLHGAAAYGGISLAKVDNNGYRFQVARWAKSGSKWRNL